MARVNMMGFKKVTGGIPASVARKGASIYDPLLQEVRSMGGTYALDTKDQKRAASLSSTLRAVIRKRGYDDVHVTMRYTMVYIESTLG